MVLLELFSGIGGFSKGLQAAGYSFEKVYFANFKYNFPYAEHIGSVTVSVPVVRTIAERIRRNTVLND